MQIEKLSLDKQIELFQGTQKLVQGKIGKKAADKFFKEASYVVALGSNDFINNYLMPVYPDSWTYNDETFMDYLIGTLERQLMVYFVYFNTIIYSSLSVVLFLLLESNNKVLSLMLCLCIASS